MYLKTVMKITRTPHLTKNKSEHVFQNEILSESDQ
jgi:hypothetical protein